MHPLQTADVTRTQVATILQVRNAVTLLRLRYSYYYILVIYVTANLIINFYVYVHISYF